MKKIVLCAFMVIFLVFTNASADPITHYAIDDFKLYFDDEPGENGAIIYVTGSLYKPANMSTPVGAFEIYGKTAGAENTTYPGKWYTVYNGSLTISSPGNMTWTGVGSLYTLCYIDHTLCSDGLPELPPGSPAAFESVGAGYYNHGSDTYVDIRWFGTYAWELKKGDADVDGDGIPENFMLIGKAIATAKVMLPEPGTILLLGAGLLTLGLIRRRTE